MARATHAHQTAPGTAIDAGVVLTMNAATGQSGTNGEQTAFAKVLIIAQNTGASPYDVTFTSIADALGRTTTSVNSLAADAIAIFGPFAAPEGWKQTDGNLYFEASNAAVKFAVVRIP